MQGNLLDTHTFIWFINGDNSLSKKAKMAIEMPDAVNYISIASIWEIAVKVSLDKLALNAPFSEIQEQIAQNNFELLPVNFDDTLTVSQLPFIHRDPFDRLIIAQAINNNLVIISRDVQFKDYNVSLLF